MDSLADTAGFPRVTPRSGARPPSGAGSSSRRVQAVGFRASCARRAVDAGVGGWVRNPGGGVEAVFEGPAGGGGHLGGLVPHRTTMARVDGIEITDDAPSGDAAFVIR